MDQYYIIQHDLESLKELALHNKHSMELSIPRPEIPTTPVEEQELSKSIPLLWKQEHFNSFRKPYNPKDHHIDYRNPNIKCTENAMYYELRTTQQKTIFCPVTAPTIKQNAEEVPQQTDKPENQEDLVTQV